MAALQRVLLVAIPLLFAAAPAAQAPTSDQITLKNGDQITGTVKAMAGGKLTINSPLAGDVTVDMADVTRLVTAKAIKIRTKAGDILERQVTGIDNGTLQLAAAPGGATAPGVAVADLDAFNPPPEQWTGSVNIGAGFVTGNTERRSALAQADAVRRTMSDRITARGAWTYAEEKTVPADWNLTERRLEGSLKYDYFLSKRSYVYAQTSALGDTRADLRLRYTAGGGYGYQWIEEPHLQLGTEAGISYFSETYRTAGVPSSETVAARLAYALRWAITDGITFLQNVEYFPSLEDSSDLFVTKDSRLRLGLSQSMFAQGQWLLDFDNTPSPGRERMDHRFFLSLGWTF